PRLAKNSYTPDEQLLVLQGGWISNRGNMQSLAVVPCGSWCQSNTLKIAEVNSVRDNTNALGMHTHILLKNFALIYRCCNTHRAASKRPSESRCAESTVFVGPVHEDSGCSI